MTRCKHWNILQAVLLVVTPALTIAASEPKVKLFSLRDYGYVMGDLIEHTLTVAVPEGYALDSALLPTAGALNPWLDLRSLDWDMEYDQGEEHYQIRVVYQVFKGIRAAEKATVPSLPLHFRGPESLEANATAWEFTMTPLIPPDLADENVAIRGALPPETLAIGTHWQRLLVCLAGIGAVSGFLIWQRLGRRRRNRPFRRACRDLRKLLRTSASPEKFRQAAKILHHALDETAGTPLFAGQIADFCKRRPAFVEVESEIRGFFELSQRLFFTSPLATLPPDYPASRLMEFCRGCAAAEGRTP